MAGLLSSCIFSEGGEREWSDHSHRTEPDASLAEKADISAILSLAFAQCPSEKRESEYYFSGFTPSSSLFSPLNKNSLRLGINEKIGSQ